MSSIKSIIALEIDFFICLCRLDISVSWGIHVTCNISLEIFLIAERGGRERWIWNIKGGKGLFENLKKSIMIKSNSEVTGSQYKVMEVAIFQVWPLHLSTKYISIRQTVTQHKQKTISFVSFTFVSSLSERRIILSYPWHLLTVLQIL